MRLHLNLAILFLLSLTISCTKKTDNHEMESDFHYGEICECLVTAGATAYLISVDSAGILRIDVGYHISHRGKDINIHESLSRIPPLELDMIEYTATDTLSPGDFSQLEDIVAHIDTLPNVDLDLSVYRDTWGAWLFTPHNKSRITITTIGSETPRKHYDQYKLYKFLRDHSPIEIELFEYS